MANLTGVNSEYPLSFKDITDSVVDAVILLENYQIS